MIILPHGRCLSSNRRGVRLLSSAGHPATRLKVFCYRLDRKLSERKLAISQMSSTPIKKQLVGLIFLLFICPSVPLGASSGGTYHVPSGQQEFRFSARLQWACCGGVPIPNKQMACRLSRATGRRCLAHLQLMPTPATGFNWTLVRMPAAHTESHWGSRVFPPMPLYIP